MGKIIRIGSKCIGDKYPCFIIAEAGVNHNGQLTIAKKLVDAAVTAKVDAVKFQTFKAEGVVTKNAGIADYAKKNIGRNLKQLTMMKQLELSYEDFKKLKKYCDKKKILFLSTPHSFDAIDFLDDLLPAFKFGSGDLTNTVALQYAARKHKPMLLGTGMATLDEVHKAIQLIRATGNHQIVALHCTTNYPCPFEEVNLNAMLTMQKKLPCLIGYSDHTIGITVPLMAATLRATVIEKHFTLDKTMPGPDHYASLEPKELAEMVTAIRSVGRALGSSAKKPTQSEKEIMLLVRKSIVADKQIQKGQTIRKNMIAIKRPGIGLSPVYYEHLLGKKAKKTILKDELIRLDMVE